jgi:hypothetical protein
MTSWSIDFAPMVPGPLFWAGAVLAAVLVAMLLLRRSRGALLRALSLATLLLALANPTLRQEERESLANIAIVVTDESLSQTIGGRPEQTAAIKRDLEGKLGAIANLQVRWVSSSKPTGEQATAHSPTRRRIGWPASSSSPTGRCTMCRSRRRRWASTRPCMRC